MEQTAKRYAIVHGATIIGPYLSKTNAQFRVREMRAQGKRARLITLVGDKEFFPKPMGNRTNH